MSNDRGDDTSRQPRLFRLDVGEHRVERDVDTELAFHLEMRVRRLVDKGMDPATARAQALRQFGDWDDVRAQCLDIDYQKQRAVKRANYFEELRQDAGYALRSLRHNAGFAAVVVLSLAVAIGANTAIFTLIDALLLRPLPVPNPEQLVAIGNPARVNGASTGSPRTDLLSYPLYQDLRKDTRLVTGLAATGRTGRLDLIIGDSQATGRDPSEPEHARGRLVTGNYFSVLQVPALLGRTFTGEEDRAPNASPVAVISHSYWERRFAADRSVIGRSIRVNGTPFTIIGVAAPGFHGEVVGRMTDIWLPATMQPAIMHNRDWLADRGASWLLLIGRRAPGVTLEQTRAGFTMLVRQSVAAADPTARVVRDQAPEPVPIESAARGLSSVRNQYGESLATLMVAVGLVLLIVCANVANLLLARGAARGRELGVRMALGAGRVRLVRQLLTESVLLSALGGAVGLLFALWGSRALLELAAGGPSPIPLDIGLDWRVLTFTAALTALTAVLFGLVPALRATRVELAATLRSNARGLTGGLLGAPGKLGAGKLLVVFQVALSLMLLVGTSMLVRSASALGNVDTGLARDRLLIVTVDVAPTGQEGENLAALARTLLERVRRIPGVASASLSENGIFSGTESITTFRLEGFTAHSDQDTTAFYDRVGPGYFVTIGARLIQGRDISASDDEHAANVVVINSTMASFLFPRGGAIGRHIAIDSSPPYEIVGVVADIKDHELRQTPVPRMYLPIHQTGVLPSQFTFELRTDGDPAKLVGPVRQALLAANGSLLVLDNDPLTMLMRLSISQDHLVAQVASFFGTLALALAALGLYGVMTYATQRRTSEFGLRMALGAEPRNVARLVLGEAMALVAGGALLGLPLAVATTRLLRSQLFGIGVIDLPSIALALAVLGVSAALAGYLPASRAARVGPLEALRAE